MLKKPVKPRDAAKDKAGAIQDVKPLTGQKGKYQIPSTPVGDAQQGGGAGQADQTHWIEIELQYPDGKAVQAMPSGKPVKFRLIQGNTAYDGELDGDGKARVDGLPAGNVDVTFPEIDPTEWKK